MRSSANYLVVLLAIIFSSIMEVRSQYVLPPRAKADRTEGCPAGSFHFRGPYEKIAGYPDNPMRPQRRVCIIHLGMNDVRYILLKAIRREVKHLDDGGSKYVFTPAEALQICQRIDELNNDDPALPVSQSAWTGTLEQLKALAKGKEYFRLASPQTVDEFKWIWDRFEDIKKHMETPATNFYEGRMWVGTKKGDVFNEIIRWSGGGYLGQPENLGKEDTQGHAMYNNPASVPKEEAGLGPPGECGYLYKCNSARKYNNGIYWFSCTEGLYSGMPELNYDDVFYRGQVTNFEVACEFDEPWPCEQNVTAVSTCAAHIVNTVPECRSSSKRKIHRQAHPLHEKQCIEENEISNQRCAKELEEKLCKTDCQWTWGEWSPCDPPCVPRVASNGTKSRKAAISVQAGFGGKDCEKLPANQTDRCECKCPKDRCKGTVVIRGDMAAILLGLVAGLAVGLGGW